MTVSPAAISPAWYAVILLLLDTVQDDDAGTGNGDAEESQP